MISRLKDEPMVIRRLKGAARQTDDERVAPAAPEPIDLPECRRRLTEILGAQVVDCFRLVSSSQTTLDSGYSLEFVSLLLTEHLPVRIEIADLRNGQVCFSVSGYDLYGRAHPIRNHADHARIARFPTLGKALVEAERGFRMLRSQCRAPWRRSLNEQVRGSLPEEIWLHDQLYSQSETSIAAQTSGFEAVTCEVWSPEDDAESQAIVRQIDEAARKLGRMRAVDPLTLRTGSRVLFRIRGRGGRFYNAAAILVDVEQDGSARRTDAPGKAGIPESAGGRLGRLVEEEAMAK